MKARSDEETPGREVATDTERLNAVLDSLEEDGDTFVTETVNSVLRQVEW